MGKKYRNLFEQISNIDNLRDAYKKVIKNGNRCKREALEFKEYLEVNLHELQKELYDETYQVEMFKDFFPYRRDVSFFESIECSILPLINQLSFIQDKNHWGYPFRYGHLEIKKADFLTIASYMININILNQIKEDI